MKQMILQNNLKSIEQKRRQKQRKRRQDTKNPKNKNYLGSIASYDTRSGNEVGLFCEAGAPRRV